MHCDHCTADNASLDESNPHVSRNSQRTWSTILVVCCPDKVLQSLRYPAKCSSTCLKESMQTAFFLLNRCRYHESCDTIMKRTFGSAILADRSPRFFEAREKTAFDRAQWSVSCTSMGIRVENGVGRFGIVTKTKVFIAKQNVCFHIPFRSFSVEI